MHTVKINNVYHVTSDQARTLCGVRLPDQVMLDDKHRHETSCSACAEKVKQVQPQK